MPFPDRIRSRSTSCWIFVFLILLALLPATSALAKKKSDQPDTAAAQLSFGVKMAQRGLWAEALFRFKRARLKDPSNPRVLNNLAVAYEALGNFDKALELYQEAIRSDPSNKELKRNYSRFVEFYRSFKPDQQQGDEADKSVSEGHAALAEDQS